MYMKTIIPAAIFSTAFAAGAMAAPVTVDFEAEVLSNQVVDEFGFPAGFDDTFVGSTGMGSFTFDDSMTGFVPIDAFSLTLGLGGVTQTFTEADLDPFLGGEVFVDSDGTALDVFFEIFDDDAFTLAFEDIIDAPGVFAIEAISFTPGGDGMPAFVGLEIQTTPAPIPLPASLPILLSGFAAFGLVRSRRAKS
jgi:hypothetical protein